MKKFVSGLIVGALLMISTQAFGANISFIGKKVDGQVEVKVDGSVVGTAVVIQGKSFAPVRDIVNSFGGTVDSTTGGVIALSSNSSEQDNSNPAVITEVELNKKIEKQQSTVDRISGIVSELQKKVEELKGQGIDPITQNIELKLMQDQLIKETKSLDTLKDQLSELQK